VALMDSSCGPPGRQKYFYYFFIRQDLISPLENILLGQLGFFFCGKWVNWI
jgi:hypothetical protein